VVAGATAFKALALPRPGVAIAAAATATVIDPVDVVAVMAGVPEEMAFTSGLLLSKVGVNAVGTVVLTVHVEASPFGGQRAQTTPMAQVAQISQTAEIGANPAAHSGLGNVSISQNLVQVSGALKGDPVAAITVSANSGGSLASSGPGTVVLTVEYN
jgi:hypothetical protein